MLNARSSRFAAVMAMCCSLTTASASFADTIIGNWESGTAEGWIDWQLAGNPIDVPLLPGRWAFNSTGATLGTNAVQFHSDGGYVQNLAVKLQIGDPPGSGQSNGISEWRDDFLTNTKIAFDLTLVQSEFAAGNDFMVQSLIINADGYGFKDQDGSAADQPTFESIESFVGQNLDGMSQPTNSFNPLNLVGTQKSTWVYDIGYLHDGNAANGEVAINPGNGLPNYVELIFVQYSNGGTTIHIDNVRLFTPVVGLPGDFNGNHVVDAADYTVWRDHLGAADESSLNGNGNGASGVDAADYELWKIHFGEMSAGSGSLGSKAVPEPASAILGVLVVGILSLARLGRPHRSE